MEAPKVSKIDTLTRLMGKTSAKTTRDSSEFEREIARRIIALPSDVADGTSVEELFGRDYDPGTFMLSERESNPAFLFDEDIQEYKEWVFHKVDTELRLLSRIPALSGIIKKCDISPIFDEDRSYVSIQCIVKKF